jgi:thymidylate synthase (FAD)
MNNIEIKLTSDITVTQIATMGGDWMVTAAAKVSVDPESAMACARDEQANKGLINYLMKQRHGSPFEHSAMTFFVHAPICVFREWHRHRIGFSYNEESARYKTLDPTFYIPAPNRPMIPKPGFKSARPGFDFATQDEYDRLVWTMSKSYAASYAAYLELIGDGEVPLYDRGLARDVLPVGIYSS